MKITYDPEADAIYIKFTNRTPLRAIELEEGVNYDIDENGHLIGLEILDASVRFNENYDKIEFVRYPLILTKQD